MASTPDLAILALRVYSTPGAVDGIDTELNRPAVPSSWIEKEWYADDGTGFSYGVYQNGTEIVIAYAGTNENGDWLTNIANGVGLGSTQTTKAALAYLQTKQQYGSNITFTGHSLGGGLASIMSVWFDRPAVVFDEATFEVAARSPLIILATKASLAMAGYDLGAFASYTGILEFPTREANVTNHYLEGEALYYLRLALPAIVGTGQDHVVRANISDVTGAGGTVDLHSQGLLAATLVSNNFRQATYASSRVIPLLMDKGFYAYSNQGRDENVLINFIRSEEANQGDGKLTHFAADLQKLGTHIAGLNKAAQDALIAQGIEWYYWQRTGYAGKEFFTQTGSLLQYTTAIGDELTDAKNKAASFVGKWLTPIFNAHNEFYSPVGTLYDQWNVAAGPSGVSATARDAGKRQIFIGQGGSDIASGGQKDDLLFGGGGNDQLAGGRGDDKVLGGTGADTLDGGEGNDTLNAGTGADLLLGGAGADAYIIGQGADTIKDDKAGQGSVTNADGKAFTGGSTDLYSILVRNWSLSELVIARSSEEAAPSAPPAGSISRSRRCRSSKSCGKRDWRNVYLPGCFAPRTISSDFKPRPMSWVSAAPRDEVWQ